ncbi:MAG: hypothetical protein HY809_10970 [Nitrospirae bacterium]|nr:hypothetical protein [Nitrospirota bacterium]
MELQSAESKKKGGGDRMKKPLSMEALAKEAAFWESLKKTDRENPGKVCRK